VRSTIFRWASRFGAFRASRRAIRSITFAPLRGARWFRYYPSRKRSLRNEDFLANFTTYYTMETNEPQPQDNKAQIKRISTIQMRVGLDAEQVPVYIDWHAEDSPDTPEPVECKAFLLSIFDKKYRDTFKIDLWTQEMQVNEMDRFMFQTLRSLADTYYKATNNSELASAMQGFVQYFGEKTEILPKENAE
jgi:gliding motility-associated protein GldC